MKKISFIFGMMAAAGCLTAPAGAQNGHPIKLTAAYTADLVAAPSPETAKKTIHFIDALEVFLDADLDRAVGWHGATLHAELLNNLGASPNNTTGSLQGIDNIEVTRHRLRVFEAWLEQAIGTRTTIRAGLYDVNSEFYANDAAGDLIAPAFGMGSEISATGTNGPSVYPSTALSLRVRQNIGKTGFISVAAVNAAAGTLGDPQGIDMSFRQGELLIAEVGIDGASNGKIGIGGWTYTKLQDDLRPGERGGQDRSRAFGVYLVADRSLLKRANGMEVIGFARLGLSDGRTTPFRGGWQGGVMIRKPFAARPEGVLSIGANQGILSGPFRRNQADGGTATSNAETAIEITYADQIVPHVRLQPDVQWVFHAGGDQARHSAVVLGLRLSITS